MRAVSTRGVFAVASLLSVVCRRPAVFRPHRDVSTTQGTVRGYLTPTHVAYFGIPYARSPTRRDRYKAPEPPPTWDGIFEATHKIKCPQEGEEGEENCLVINIFAPRHATPLPVYVFVHDGDLKNGWGSHEPPERLLKDFTIVTFNYRLGALGFLCLGTPEVLGNAGLKDQIAALYWIKRNIENFGGNPDQVIVHGIGSAAVTIQLLLLTGFVDGLIHKVIMESRSVLSPLAMSYDPISAAYQGAVEIGYEGGEDPDELHEFYENASFEDLTKISGLFLPCVENESHSHSLIDFDPLHKLKGGKYHKVPTIITYTDRNDVRNVTESLDEPPLIEELIPSNLEFQNDEIKKKVGEIIKNFYFGSDIFTSEDAERNFLEYNYDVLVEYPVVNFAMLYAGNGPHIVYLMKFTTEGDENDVDPLITSGTILESLHRAKGDSNIVLEKLITLWSNFITMGDPTPLTTSLIPVIWQPVVKDTIDEKAIASIPTLRFGTRLHVSPPPRNQRLVFWDNIYRSFYKPFITEKDKTDEEEDDLDDND